MQQNVNVNAKRWLKKEIKPYNGYIALLTVLNVLATVFSLAFAFLVRYLINDASAGNKNGLIFFAILLLAVLFSRILLQALTGYLAERLCSKIVVQLRLRIFSKLIHADYASSQKYHSGELLNRLTTDIQEVATDSVRFTPMVVSMCVQCVGAIVALLTIDPLFTGIYVVCGGLFAGITAIFRNQIKKRQKAVLQADGQSRAFMQESLASTLALKSYSAEQKTQNKAQSFFNAYYQARMKRNVLGSTMNGVYSILSNFGLVFALVWCGISLLGGNTDYGSILSVILLLMQFQQPLSGISAVIPIYYARLTSGERLQELDALPSDRIQADNPISLPFKDIFVNNVQFSYGRENVLNNVNFTVQQGETVCFTGSSGAGKSTIFKLLLNVYSPTGGSIQINGQPLTSKDRRYFAYVPQGNFLFSGTIYENLTFFTDEKDETLLKEKIKKALKIACAEFVFDLPEGLNTLLNERGTGLSEGQMQRLNIARAILSNRDILLFDEATSALDVQTELALLENIRSLTNKTCLIITHRQPALAIADRILQIEQGTVKELKK